MYPFVKRSIDVVGAGLGLIVLSPVLAVVALAIWMQMGRPLIFRQMRPGLYGQPFYMYKFRTMSDQRDEYGNLLPDEQRLTRTGRLLRSTSLDEFPGLINVLKGKISLVGPRPLLMNYLERYTPEQARRHEVKPGITGWAQVNGRNSISWEEKFAMDVWYVDNCSLWLDVKILFMTVFKVFKRDGISADGEATMSEFMGSTVRDQYLNIKDAQKEAAASLD
jgi:lipopolysaccharide/colanic/teichoic acid biosynthesis glycosyltransferase